MRSVHIVLIDKQAGETLVSIGK